MLKVNIRNGVSLPNLSGGTLTNLMIMQSPNRSLTMSMAKQIFYHNIKQGNKSAIKIFERDIKPYLNKIEVEIYEKDIKPELKSKHQKMS
jgi:hypothetical protein